MNPKNDDSAKLNSCSPHLTPTKNCTAIAPAKKSESMLKVKLSANN